MPLLFTFYFADRDQPQVHVPYLLQDTVQSRLVGKGTTKGGAAVIFAGESQPIEPFRPLVLEMPLDTNFVYFWFTTILGIFHNGTLGFLVFMDCQDGLAGRNQPNSAH